ncbi:hypothetical protein [Burkholderia sp. IMCC1007]|uniref:hypothetical protein n=1 Tax=Burkholderia sp. IMCC1007 TaxID=3004104 RepID=UPI0022B32082|nr:hypothetical protein [Burkholderia sp. IMCC1007]
MDTSSTALTIPAPAPDFYPRKANIYEELIRENCSLAPIFPFAHPGAIVTLTAIQRGDHRPSGRFEHQNSVDEVLLCLGSSLGFLRAGQMFVQQGGHDVSGIDSGSEDDYLVFYYYQRQKPQGAQTESLGFRCAKCNALGFAHKFDSVTSKFTSASGRELVPTVAGSGTWALRVNEDPELRKCHACGHQNDPFPLESWGWSRYMVNAELAARAELAMRELTS